jgi:hypothetical protein
MDRAFGKFENCITILLGCNETENIEVQIARMIFKHILSGEPQIAVIFWRAGLEKRLFKLMKAYPTPLLYQETVQLEALRLMNWLFYCVLVVAAE